jgi:hypothetical protein
MTLEGHPEGAERFPGVSTHCRPQAPCRLAEAAFTCLRQVPAGGGATYMQLGCLGHPLRAPLWKSRRARWRNLYRASVTAIVIGLVAFMVASDGGVYDFHRSPPGPDGETIVGSPPGASTPAAGTPHSSTVNDLPSPAVLAPSGAANLSAPPKPKHLLARLRSTSERHRQTLAAQAGPANGNGAREDAAMVHYCGHRPVRDSGCRQEGAHRPPAAYTTPPS